MCDTPHSRVDLINDQIRSSLGVAWTLGSLDVCSWIKGRMLTTRMMLAIGAFAASVMLLTLFVPLTLVKNNHLPAHCSHGQCGDPKQSSRTEQSLYRAIFQVPLFCICGGATIQELSVSSGKSCWGCPPMEGGRFLVGGHGEILVLQ